MIKKFQKLKKLNLGCDYDYRKGWVNLDQYSGKADVVHDLNKYPWPFKENTFDYVYASHVLEHLDDVKRALIEIWRISKNNAIVEIKVPYFNSYCAYGDVTHKHFFTFVSFDPFIRNPSPKNKVGYLPVLFECKEKKLVWGITNKLIFKPFCILMNWLVNLNPRFVEQRFPFLLPVEALHLKLIVKK